MWLQFAKFSHSAAVSAGFLALMSLQAKAAGDADAALPRYNLQTGQRLTYEGKSEQKFEGGSFINADKWQVTVIGRNDDGSHRVVLRYATAQSRTDVPGAAKE